jgi:hypothetical protein
MLAKPTERGCTGITAHLGRQGWRNRHAWAGSLLPKITPSTATYSGTSSLEGPMQPMGKPRRRDLWKQASLPGYLELMSFGVTGGFDG